MRYYSRGERPESPISLTTSASSNRCLARSAIRARRIRVVRDTESLAADAGCAAERRHGLGMGAGPDTRIPARDGESGPRRNLGRTRTGTPKKAMSDTCQITECPNGGRE